MKNKFQLSKNASNAEEYIKELKLAYEKGELSDAEIREAIEEISQKRIAEILSAESCVEIKGATYYMSADGNDENDGLSPQSSWKSIEKLNSAPLKEGDGVLFRRGDIFRGSIAAKAGVTYAAYGKGAKPKIYVWDKNSASPELWKKTDAQDVWEYAETYDIDIGAIVFDDKICARKVYQSNETDGRWLDYRAKREFHDYHDLVDDMSFWHSSQNSQGEEKTGKLYLKCKAGNPGEIFSEIEMNKKISGFVIGRNNNIRIDNLCIAHAGVHGIASGSNDGLTVTNCEIKWIGGTIQCPIRGYGSRSWPTPFGNAVEIYGEAKNYKVDNCYIWQAYDAGVTHQCGEGTAPINNINVRYTNNVFDNCVYSVEIFYGNSPEKDRTNKDCLVAGNIMRRGGGFGHIARPDEGVTALIRNGRIIENTEDYIVRNNIMDRSRAQIITAANDGGSKAQYYDNIYVQNRGGKYCTRLGESFVVDDELPKKLEATGTEHNPTFVFTEEADFE